MEYSTVVFLFYLLSGMFTLGLSYLTFFGVPVVLLVIIAIIVIGIAFQYQKDICDWLFIKFNS